MKLPRRLILAAPMQAGSPWHVAVAKILGHMSESPLIQGILDTWPTPEQMEQSDILLEELCRPLGLHRQRARQIQQLSRRWYTDTWVDLRELPGVREYVADAVALACFSGMWEVDGLWYPGRYQDPVEAYREHTRLTSSI